MGSDVDAHLTDHLLVALRRRELHLSGYGGRLPRASIAGEVNKLPGVKVILEFGSNDQLEARVLPRVLRGAEEGGPHSKEIVVGDTDLPELPGILNKIRRRMGEPPLSPSEIATQYPIQSLDRPMVTFAPEIDTHNYRRAILKIVYELAHRWLGDKYLDDPVAEILRAIIFNSSFGPEDFQRSALRAQVLIGNDLLPALPIDARVSHLAYLTRFGAQLIGSVQIFDIFQALVVVSEAADHYAHQRDMAVLLNAKDSSLMESTLDELVTALFNDRRGCIV